MTIEAATRQATARLAAAGIGSAKLDAELLLGLILERPRLELLTTTKMS